jgi:GxxExxY protein
LEWNELTKKILDGCFSVHTKLGPGLLESVYQDSLAMELEHRGIRYQKELMIPVHYEGEIAGDPLRLDLLADDVIVVEVKAVERLHSIHASQVLTYLKLTSKPIGLLVNFNTVHLRDGIRRIINTPFQ